MAGERPSVRRVADRAAPACSLHPCGSLLGGIAANLGVGFAAATSIGYTCINLGEALAGRWLVRRFCPDAPRLSQPLNGFALIACGVMAAVGGGAIAGLVAMLTSSASWLGVFGTWTSSDATGIVIVTPVLVATAGAVTELRGPLPRRRLLEALFILAVLVVTSAYLYLWKHPSPLDQFANPLLILPLIAWAAIRFEATGAAWAVLIVNAFCLWGTALGYGPLFDLTPSSLVNLVVQARVGVTGMVALSLAPQSAPLVDRLPCIDVSRSNWRQLETRSARVSLTSCTTKSPQKLAALKMQLQLTEMDPMLDRRKSTASSVAIVDDLLSEVRAMSHSLRPAPFDEGQLMPALNALAKSEGTRGRLTVLIESPDNELSVPRNIELVCYRVVREAIANVVKHARARNVCVFVDYESDQLTVSIVDDGRGFDVAPTSRQAVRDGHLGLVGMRERLSRVGGTMSVNSTVGQGTTVTCPFPWSCSMSYRVLIVDDHPLMRAGIRTLLEKTIPDVTILEAVDGLDAIELASQARPDIVLMDISMPGLNGVEAARRITAYVPGCKVIMLSMHQDEQRVVEAIRAGASGYLMKDVAVAEVRIAIESALQRRRLHQPERAENGHADAGEERGWDESAFAADRAATRDPAAHRGRPVNERDRIPVSAEHEDRRDAPAPPDGASRHPRGRQPGSICRSCRDSFPRTSRPLLGNCLNRDDRFAAR